jgi:glutathione peroxidase
MSFIVTYAQKSHSMSQSIHQFTVTDISGEPFDMASLKGKKVMIVNTASKCGLTPQYQNLQELYDQYNCDNFEVIGFPANNFLWQEPGSDEEIGAFCEKNYGVTFPMMSKISVKGRKIHPLYAFLTKKEQNGVIDSKVKWNFQKYLIDENGKLIRVVGPRVLPDDQSIIDWIKS